MSVETDTPDAILKEITSEALDLAAEIGAFVSNRMVEYTPRRKGVAQASYRIGINKPDPSVAKEGTFHPKPEPTRAAEIRAGLHKLGDSIHATNNLWRIVFLEDGTKTNRPSRMARRALSDADARFAR